MWCVTYRLLYSWNEPPSSSRIFANRTAFKNGTSTNSSKFNSTENLYFFFFIMNAIPGAPGPINVIHATSKPTKTVEIFPIYVEFTFWLLFIFLFLFEFKYISFFLLLYFAFATFNFSLIWMSFCVLVLYIYEKLHIFFMFNLISLNDVVNLSSCLLYMQRKAKLFCKKHETPMIWCASACHSMCTKARCVRRQHSCK